jgi:hypothetical protein
MKTLCCKLVMTAGYTDTNHFINSAFHPKMSMPLLTLSGIAATFAYYFDLIFGIKAIIGISILILFLLEFYTGLSASRKEGKKFDSELFGKGWLKLLVYMIMIGVSNTLANNILGVNIIGYKFNIYEWLHDMFYNYVLLNLILSNLENFKRLGWTEHLPVLKALAKYVKDEPKIDKDGKDS